MQLSEREKEVLLKMRSDRIAAIQRKRSWRASEKAISIAEVTRLTERLLKEGDNHDGHQH